MKIWPLFNLCKILDHKTVENVRNIINKFSIVIIIVSFRSLCWFLTEPNFKNYTHTNDNIYIYFL